VARPEGMNEAPESPSFCKPNLAEHASGKRLRAVTKSSGFRQTYAALSKAYAAALRKPSMEPGHDALIGTSNCCRCLDAGEHVAAKPILVVPTSIARGYISRFGGVIFFLNSHALVQAAIGCRGAGTRGAILGARDITCSLGIADNPNTPLHQPSFARPGRRNRQAESPSPQEPQVPSTEFYRHGRRS
jgi:hypothetical protein